MVPKDNGSKRNDSLMLIYMIKGIVKDLLEEIKKPKIQCKIQDAVLSPVLHYVMIFFTPYFVIMVLLLLVVIILLIINIYVACR